MASVLRHKTNPELSEKLAIFARQNKYFSLDIYKENWDKWYNENTELILEEDSSTKIFFMGQECIARLFQAPIFLKKSTEPLDNDVVLLSGFLFSSNRRGLGSTRAIL